MFSNQVAEVSLNVPTKCLEAIRADKLESRFIVGTCSLHEPNELTVLRFHPDINELGIDGRLDHPSGPVGMICTNPTDKYLLLTAAEENPTVNLWRVPQEVMDRTDEFEYNPDTVDCGSSTQNPAQSNADNAFSLDLVTTLPHDPDSHIVDIIWRDTSTDFDDEEESNNIGLAGQVLTLDHLRNVTQWDINTAQSVRSEHLSSDSTQLTPPKFSWDPHNSYSVAVTVGSSINILDWRSNPSSIPTGTSSRIPNAHRYGVTAVDYNPNKPNVLATAGHDGLLKFWDLRNAKKPLLVARGGHSHYAWRVQYNPFHDQLVLSTGTDAIVNMWRVSTISSAPMILGESTISSGRRSASTNVLVSRFEHNDSVYGMAWGAADAWIYTTAGYDGRVALHHVPSTEKYKILL